MNKFLTLLLASALLCTAQDGFAQKKKKGGKKKASTAVTKAAPADTMVKAVSTVNLLDPPNLDSAGYNALSVRPVHKSDIMYKMGVWRRINLQEKCNEPFNAKGQEFASLIMQAVFDGKLTAYTSDSVNRRMTVEQFKEKMKDPTVGEVAPAATAAADDWGNAAAAAGAAPAAATGPILLGALQLYLFDLREDLLFDKQRSRMLYDIQTITMVLDSKFSVKGFEERLASFRYVDLAHLFATMPNAKWYNFENRAEDKKIADAFDLRLFCSRITKISNPRDDEISAIDAYNKSDKTQLITSQQFEYDLVEKENELWDF